MLFTPRAKGLGAENFVKISDGEEVTGIFRGELHTFKKHWSADRSIECTGEGCVVCRIETEKNANEADPKKKKFPGFRFRINFVSNKDGQWFAKIFEGGGELYDQLVNLNKKFDLTKTVVDISRSGLRQNTKYHITPRPDQPITKEMESVIKSVTLCALTAEKLNEALGA